MSDRAVPILSVADLRAARDFYASLGFAQTYQFNRVYLGGEL